MRRFKYLDAPESEMKGLLAGLRRCDLCGGEERCFDLTRAIRPAGVNASIGCVSCLSLGRFGFFHATALGYLEEGGLTWYDDAEAASPPRAFVVDQSGRASAVAGRPELGNPVTVPAEALEELTRTPSFPTWNEVAWPVHCSDFMVYLGPWAPRDVRAAALARQCQPREFFGEMTSPEEQGLWADDAEAWAFTFHVFKCPACGKFRGAVDLD